MQPTVLKSAPSSPTDQLYANWDLSSVSGADQPSKPKSPVAFTEGDAVYSVPMKGDNKKTIRVTDGKLKGPATVQRPDQRQTVAAAGEAPAYENFGEAVTDRPPLKAKTSRTLPR